MIPIRDAVVNNLGRFSASLGRDFGMSHFRQSRFVEILNKLSGDSLQLFPVEAGCVADLNGDFPEPDPLFLRPNTSYDDSLLYESAFILPSLDDGLLHFELGETVRVVCSGSSLKLTGKSEELAVCSGGNT